MPRVRMIISYDGTSYVGWQVQNNGVSVQALLEQGLFALVGEECTVQGSGRTDSGVHARAQVAHFDTHARMSPDKFAVALNTRLPRDIRVLYSEGCETDFHARFSAKNKEYRYRLLLSPHQNPFTRHYALHIHRPLDIEAMNRAAALLVGEHDFAAFKSQGVPVESTVRTVYESRLEQEGCYLSYIVRGNGFMYNMVRILMGTLLEVGIGKLPIENIEKALLTGDRSLAGPTAPPQGLTLHRVIYPDFDTEDYLPYGF